MKRAIALIDCNNFYVSCERLFRPDLAGKPVVILSNNDGCVVSRSQEVKDLGVSMAAPWFQLKHIAAKHHITAFSSNYTLYADISNRVMRLLSQYAPNQEVYSIDECFMELTGMSDISQHARNMKQNIARCVGIPVCVGIAPSKTLAKLANHVAKKMPRLSGVCNFNELSDARLDQLLDRISVADVWGVGRRTATHLNNKGIASVLELKRARGLQLGIVMERTVTELNGIACHELDMTPASRQQIVCSRSFGIPVKTLAELEQAVTTYTSRAAEKLRGQHAVAGCIQVCLRTNPHSTNTPQHHPALTLALDIPSDDTRTLCRAALAGLRQIYQTGYDYKKAGVMLSAIHTERSITLFDDEASRQKSQTLMATMDKINRRMGSGTLRLSGEGYHKDWEMKRESRSQNYTTRLAEIAIARA